MNMCTYIYYCNHLSSIYIHISCMYFHTCNMYIWIMYDWVRAFQNWRTLDFHSHLWGQHNSFLLSSPRKHFHVFQKLMVQQMGRRAPKNPRSARLRDWRMVSKNPGQSGQTYWAGEGDIPKTDFWMMNMCIPWLWMRQKGSLRICYQHEDFYLRPRNSW